MTVVDLPAVLSAYLIAGGTLGRREAEIFKRFRHIPREELLLELKVMWDKHQVQRFTMDKKHIWRATEDLNL